VLNQDTSSKLISKLHSLLMFRSPFQVEFNIIRVFVHLIKRCGLSWDLRKSTKTCITNTVKSWDVKQNIPLPARLVSNYICVGMLIVDLFLSLLDLFIGCFYFGF